jgi:deoxycytidylate deaminase
MALAVVAAGASKSSLIAGAVAVTSHGRDHVVAWDALPSSLPETSYNWNEEFTVHAEMQALGRPGVELQGGTLYVTRYPCLECLKQAFHRGIKRVVYMTRGERIDWEQCMELSKLVYAQLDEFKGNINWLRDHIRRGEEGGLFYRDSDS